MENIKKINCIIDSDPGVDDCAAILLSLYDELMDIKLITTLCGNLSLDKVTRNALHLLEKFERTDIPVARGAEKALKRVSPDATFIHQKEGMGNYLPPDEVDHKTIESSAVEAMYKVICENKGDISIIALGPQTNIASLILAHPDVTGMISRIYTEGCAPYGWKGQGKWKHYISFNASSDPEALKIVLESGIPITYVPSRMGRDLAQFNEEEVFKIRDINDTGRFIAEMYTGYWEHGYEDRRIATNDTCACMCLRFPELFKTKKVHFEVDTEEQPGKTLMKFDKKGNVDLVLKVNKKKLHEKFYHAIEKLGRFKFYN